MKRIFNNLRDYLALRTYLEDPWKFVWTRKAPMPDGDFEVPFKGGLHVRCNTPSVDRQVLNGIFARDEYRLNGYPPGGWDTVIDIGAHIGLFSIRVAPLAKRVLSFEPMPESFKYLKANLGHERLRHVTPVEKAVSGSAGPLDLFVAANSGMHSVLADAAAGTTRVRVDAVTLAQVFADHDIRRCDLLKLDCEGVEYGILGAAPAELWPRIERIHMEYHPGVPGWDEAKLTSFLEGHGYACERVPRSRHPGLGNLFAARKPKS
jgi:FkbM family methyltransferase